MTQPESTPADLRRALHDTADRIADFRESRVLEDRGLPRYDLSLVRFLGCAACFARGDKTPLELFLVGPQGWDAAVRRQFVDAVAFSAAARSWLTAFRTGRGRFSSCNR